MGNRVVCLAMVLPGRPAPAGDFKLRLPDCPYAVYNGAMSLLEQRFNWLFNQRLQTRPRGQRRPIPASGLVIVGGVTAVFLIWLLYRLILQPTWMTNLPGLLAETLQLIEVAGAFTIVLLWILLLGRRHPLRTGNLPLVPLEALYDMSPLAFEKYVAGLFARRGYRVVHRGRTGDLGVDLELTNGHGRRAIVQCKRYRSTVGAEIIRELYGTLIHERVAHAFLVTTADISNAAREWAKGKPITLIDGTMLTQVAAALHDGTQLR